MVKPGKYRTWPIFLFGFAFLTALMALLGYYAFRVAGRIHAEVSSIHEMHRRSAGALSQIQSLTYQSAVLLRDVALTPGLAVGPTYRGEFARLRSSAEDQLKVLDLHFGRDYAGILAQLRRELREYWKAQELVFSAPAGQAGALAADYLRQQIVPRRLAVLSIADEVDRLNRANLSKEAEKSAVSLEGSRRFLGSVFSVALLLAAAVTGFAVARVSRLERQSEGERQRAEDAERELRRLSQELVRAQEEERRALSRELHDEVGQTLTGLRLELGHLERLRAGPEGDFKAHVEDAKALAETSLRTVRDLAMGLRPSILDDLGLGPALGWQAREFSRRTGVPVNVDCPTDLATLPDQVRTCLYRVAQEALTNCARHARAGNVRVEVRQEPEGVSLTVEDDGIGLDPSECRGRGLGLLGIEERVKELGGTVSISSHLYLGTRLTARIPLS